MICKRPTEWVLILLLQSHVHCHAHIDLFYRSVLSCCNHGLSVICWRRHCEIWNATAPGEIATPLMPAAHAHTLLSIVHLCTAEKQMPTWQLTQAINAAQQARTATYIAIAVHCAFLIAVSVKWSQPTLQSLLAWPNPMRLAASTAVAT